jgi:pyruvate formate lyase activating enzyme
MSVGTSPSLAWLPLLVAKHLVVGGLTPFTTIDFPGRLAAVVFCQGCPWRGDYCHNPQLQTTHGGGRAWEDVLGWLESRRGLLDGVVFSGGEPLLQRGLAKAAEETRHLGFAVGLHSAGIYPERLAAVLPAFDWVGFDVKGPFADYRRITGTGGEAASESLALLLADGTDHEIRCTVDTDLLDADALARMASQLAALGVSRLVLQACRRAGQPARVPEALVAAAAQHLPRVETRDA